MPRPSAERRQRADQHVVPLAWHDRGHAQQLDDVAAGAARLRRRIGAGLDDRDGRSRHVVGSESRRRRPARHHDVRRGPQRPALARLQRGACAGGEPGLVGQRMVHERHEREPAGFARGLVGQRAEREAVDDDARPGRQRRQRARRGGPRLGGRKREVAGQLQHRHGPAAAAEPGDDFAVVAVPAGQRRQRTRHHETDARPAARHWRTFGMGVIGAGPGPRRPPTPHATREASPGRCRSPSP